MNKVADELNRVDSLANSSIEKNLRRITDRVELPDLQLDTMVDKVKGVFVSFDILMIKRFRISFFFPFEPAVPIVVVLMSRGYRSLLRNRFQSNARACNQVSALSFASQRTLFYLNPSVRHERRIR